MKKRIMSLESWCKELIYYNKSVAWIDKFGKKHKLWSKVPSQDEDGNLVFISSDKMSIIYYDWIRENKSELLEI